MDATPMRPEKRDLNEKNIKSAQPGEILRDATVTGLHLKVYMKQKMFYLYYRTRAGVERRPKLGSHGVITLAQARKLAGDMLLEVRSGKDPSKTFRDSRDEKTLNDLFDAWWLERGSHKKSGDEDEKNWGRYFRAPLPKPGKDPLPRPPWASLGDAKLSSIVYKQMVDLHTGIKAPVQANRVIALLSALFNYAIRPLELLEKNPCEGIRKNKETKRRRYMAGAEAAEIARVLREKAKLKDNLPGVAFIYLLILTGARRGEIAKAKWSDLVDRKLVLAEHKGDKSGNDRVVHLPQAAMDVLDRLPRTTGTITGILTPTTLWETVRSEAKCPDLRLHDLRHSFASAALSDGKTLAQIGELLGHADSRTTLRYAHLMDDAASEAAASIGARIMASMASH